MEGPRARYRERATGTVDVSDEYTTRRTTALAMDRGVLCESLEPPGREPRHVNSSKGRTRRKTRLRTPARALSEARCLVAEWHSKWRIEEAGRGGGGGLRTLGSADGAGSDFSVYAVHAVVLALSSASASPTSRHIQMASTGGIFPSLTIEAARADIR